MHAVHLKWRSIFKTNSYFWEVPLGKYFQMVVFPHSDASWFHKLLHISHKSKIWFSNIVWVWRWKLLFWCADSQCNTEDNYKPINIYIILEVQALHVFLYLCFDRPGTSISTYKVCHGTLTVQDKTYRLPLQLFIHKQKYLITVLLK